MNCTTARPEEAMDAPHAMAPWARLALEAAVAAKAGKPRSAAQKPKTLRPAKMDSTKNACSPRKIKAICCY